MAAEVLSIWTLDASDSFDVQHPTGALQFGISLGEVRTLALTNKWAVEWMKTPPPSNSPPAKPPVVPPPRPNPHAA